MAPLRTTILFGLLAATAALAQAQTDAPAITRGIQRHNKWRVKTVTVTETVTADCGAPTGAGTDSAVTTDVPVTTDIPVATGGPISATSAVVTGGATKDDDAAVEGTVHPATSTMVTPSAPTDVAPPAETAGTETKTEPKGNGTETTAGAQGDGKHDVFAHYMFGIIADHTAEDWESDMKTAQSYGISAFALNIGPDPFVDAQLELAYAAAEKVGFKLFISFDFNYDYYKKDDPATVADKLKKWGKHAAAYTVDGKPMVSSFASDGFDWTAAAQAAGMELYAVPMTTSTSPGDFKGASGIFSWEAWASADNQPVDKAVSLDTDARFFSAAEKDKLDYMMPVSPWFFTHYGKEVSYSKNWLYKAEDQWLTRWDQALKAADRARFLEILTWNDFGESSYLVDPATTKAADDGHSKWTKGFSHAALMDLAKPYIAAFKSGATEPVIEKDTAVWWYRPHLKSASCDATDNCGTKPKGADLVEDVVFVAVMSKNGGSVTVTSGSNAPVTKQVEAGVQMVKVPMGAGAQTFEFKTADGATLSGKGTHEVSADCIDGRYNFNIEVGTFE